MEVITYGAPIKYINRYHVKWFTSKYRAMAEFIVLAHVSVVLLVALYKYDIRDALLGVDLVSEGYPMLFPSLFDSVSVLVLPRGDILHV